MKRFYQNVCIEQADDAYQVCLDGRAITSPLKAELLLPSKQLAQKIAEEWDAVDTDIIPAQMPFFSLAVTAIDRVATQREDLIYEMERYLLNDLLCYREAENLILQSRQQEMWDEALLWAQENHGINLVITTGIMPIEQDKKNAEKLRNLLTAMDVWQLSCFVRATMISGSGVLALRFITGGISSDHLFSLCFLDELYQIEKWGDDTEAAERRSLVQRELQDIADFLRLLG